MMLSVSGKAFAATSSRCVVTCRYLHHQVEENKRLANEQEKYNLDVKTLDPKHFSSLR